VTASIPKPKLTPRGDEWSIDYSHGAVAHFRWVPHDYPPRVVVWDLYYNGQKVETKWSSSPEIASAEAWCRAAADLMGPAPIECDDLELLRHVRTIEGATAKDAAATLRRLLRRRTGISWSVRARKNGKISICRLPRHCVFGVMRPRDVALLAAVLGRRDLVPSTGVTIGSRLGERTAAVYAIAGHEAPAVVTGVAS
jgi:hypothetical protein